MRPDYRILVDGSDRTAIFRDRLLSLSVTDESGYQADTCVLDLDDRDSRIRLPRKGAEMEVLLGYHETGRVHMGRYTVDEIEMSGPPDVLTVRGKAIDMIASLKVPKTRSWDATTIGEIVRTISSDHGLKARVGSSLSSTSIPHIDQTEESDLNFLARLGNRYDAVAKPAGDYLLFVIQGKARSSSGRATTPVTVPRNQTKNHRVTLADRDRYQSVVAYYHDAQASIRTRVREGSGTPEYTLRDPFPTSAEARAAARTKLQQLTRRLATLALTVTPGVPRLSAETPLKLTGFRPGVNRDWIISVARHRLDGTGYTTRIEASLPTDSGAN